MTELTLSRISRVCTTKAFKTIAGFTLGAIVFLGAVCFIFGRDLTPAMEMIAGILGAIGGLAGVIIGQVRSNN